MNKEAKLLKVIINSLKFDSEISNLFTCDETKLTRINDELINYFTEVTGIDNCSEILLDKFYNELFELNVPSDQEIMLFIKKYQNPNNEQ